jgi:hypothetical protein
MILGFDGESEEKLWKVDTEEWGPLAQLGYAKTISDDDLCGSPICANLEYFPGQLSVCTLAHGNPRHEWPGVSDPNGYIVACARHTIALEVPKDE